MRTGTGAFSRCSGRPSCDRRIQVYTHARTHTHTHTHTDISYAANTCASAPRSPMPRTCTFGAGSAHGTTCTCSSPKASAVRITAALLPGSAEEAAPLKKAHHQVSRGLRGLRARAGAGHRACGARGTGPPERPSSTRRRPVMRKEHARVRRAIRCGVQKSIIPCCARGTTAEGGQEAGFWPNNGPTLLPADGF